MCIFILHSFILMTKSFLSILYPQNSCVLFLKGDLQDGIIFLMFPFMIMKTVFKVFKKNFTFEIKLSFGEIVACALLSLINVSPFMSWSFRSYKCPYLRFQIYTMCVRLCSVLNPFIIFIEEWCIVKTNTVVWLFRLPLGIDMFVSWSLVYV